MNFTTARAHYTALIAASQIKPQWKAAYARAAATLVRSKGRYMAISAQTGVPWEWIAAVHWRESGGSFLGILHNGEKIIGTGRRTRLVPKNRGPFTSWEQAAVDALRLKGLQHVGDWSDERAAYEFERYNGFGYRKPGRPNSPYLWAGTNLYTRGKYVEDGVYDPNHVDQQLGAFPLYKLLKEAPAEQQLPHVSKKIKLLDRVRAALQGLIATITGLFTLDFFGIVREWFTFTGFFDPKLQITLGLAILLVYVLTNWLRKMIEDDYKEGRYNPSGECIDGSYPVEPDPMPEPEEPWEGPANG